MNKTPSEIRKELHTEARNRFGVELSHLNMLDVMNLETLLKQKSKEFSRAVEKETKQKEKLENGRF